MERKTLTDRAALVTLGAIAELIRAREESENAGAETAAALLRRGSGYPAMPARMLWFYVAHVGAGLPKKQIARLTRTHCTVVRELIARVEDAREGAPAVEAEVSALEEAAARIVAPPWAQVG